MLASNINRETNHERRADWQALDSLLAAADRDLPRAALVPEWDNHSTEDGQFNTLGEVACTYAAWIAEGNEVVSEHDGACQLAELAEALRDTLDALDALAYNQEGHAV